MNKGFSCVLTQKVGLLLTLLLDLLLLGAEICAAVCAGVQPLFAADQ